MAVLILDWGAGAPSPYLPGTVLDWAGAGAAGGAAVAPVPADLLAAIDAWIDTQADLINALGQVSTAHPKHFISEAGRANLPYLVISGVDGAATYEAPNDGPTAPAEVLIGCFADNRNESVAIANLLTSLITDADLRWSNGSAASLKRVNPFQGATRDPERFKNAQRAWGIVARFRVLAGGG